MEKSLFERAKDWLAVVLKRPKAPTGGFWFDTSSKKKKTLPSKEDLKEFFDLYMPELQARMIEINHTPAVGSSGINDFSNQSAQCLYDWLSYSGTIRHRDAQQQNSTTATATGSDWGVLPMNKDYPQQRIAKKPIEVKLELEYEPDVWTMEGLDDKIALLKRKVNASTQHYSKSELESLVERLENRKKYEQFKDFFGQFPNTTDDLIDQLVNKYKLEMKSSDLFIPEFPKEAIDVMESYTEKVKELCGKKPVFYVIAEEGDFKKKFERRDPILLVQSPFGFYYNILGAWDKEMLILHEL